MLTIWTLQLANFPVAHLLNRQLVTLGGQPQHKELSLALNKVTDLLHQIKLCNPKSQTAMTDFLLHVKTRCRGKEAQLLRTCCYFEHKCRLHAYFCFLVQFVPYNAIILWSLLLSGQPPLSGHLAISQRWLLNGCLTILSNQLARMSIHEALWYHQVSVK